MFHRSLPPSADSTQQLGSNFLKKKSNMELEDYVIRKAAIEDCGVLHKLIQVRFPVIIAIFLLTYSLRTKGTCRLRTRSYRTENQR